MKKITKLMCVALLLASTVMAQQTKTAPAAAVQKLTKKGNKITFPPNVAQTKVNALGDVELVTDLLNTTVTVIGNSEEGIVLENKEGDKLLMNRTKKRPPFLIPIPPSLRWTPIIPKPQPSKLIGIDEKNAPIWSDANGKGKYKLEETTGKRVEYIGHVTLLR